MLELFNNKTAFLKKEPKIGFLVVIVFLILLLFLLLYICKKEIYDSYQTKGFVTCDQLCNILVVIPSDLNFDKIAQNGKYLNYEITSKELKIDEENIQTYYELTLSTDESLSNNEIVILNFYYNKQRIITKIKEKMF